MLFSKVDKTGDKVWNICVKLFNPKNKKYHFKNKKEKLVGSKHVGIKEVFDIKIKKGDLCDEKYFLTKGRRSAILIE